MNKTWFLYVVICNDETFYTGITTNIVRRLSEHNNGSRGAKYTRSRRPVKLVYSLVCDSMSDALKKEKKFKKLKRSKKIEIIYEKKIFY